MLEQPRQQQQDELMAQLQKRMAALEQENTLLRQRLADLSELEQRYRLLENRDRILEATISASNALLTIENFDEAVNTALQIIGEKLDSDRVAVIENFDSPAEQLPRWKVVYEWHSPHTVPQISHPNVAQGSYEEIKEWYALFSQGEGISCLLEEMPEPFRGGQAELSVKAFHIVPIFVEGECWGVVGFDDCREAKRRSLAELAVLKTAAACIGSAIESDRTRQALLRAEQERATQLEHINTELRQALDRLAESEERFRTLFELSSEGFNYVEFDPPYSVTLPIEEQCELYRRNLRVVKVNPAFAAMYGVDNPDDLIGLKIKDVHVEDSQKNAAFIRAIVENGYRARNIETEEIDRHGQLRYFLNSGVVTIKDNYVVNGWGTQVDITPLRETQQALLHAEQERAAELAKVNEELRQRDRLLSAVAQITKDLLEAEDVDLVIPAALQAVGEAANMSRVQLILEHQQERQRAEGAGAGNLRPSKEAPRRDRRQKESPLPSAATDREQGTQSHKRTNLLPSASGLLPSLQKLSTQKRQHIMAYEWVAAGITAQIGNPDLAMIDNDEIEVLLRELYVGRSVWRIVDDLPDSLREKFSSIEIKSTGTVPIFIEGRYIGCVAFDDCVVPRHWTQQEIDVLTAAAESIGAALHRKQLIERLIEERARAAEERAAELAGINMELQHSKTRLQDLIRTMSDWAWEVNANGIYTYADEKVYKFLGYKPEELLGKTPFDLMPPAEAKRVAQEFTQIAAERKPFRKLENINLAKDGRQVVLETSGTPIFDLQGKFLGYRGVDSDITERKQAEKALRQSETCLAQKAKELQQTLDRLTESEERYRTLFELSSEGIYRFEVNPPVSTSLPLDEQCELAEQHWRVVEANQAFASQYGLSSPEEAIGFTFETSSQAGTENLREVNHALIANGYRIRNIQTEEMDVRGNRKYFLQSIVCDIEDGFIKGGWGMQADVTELRQAQQKLLQAAKEQAAKLESVNAVLHESVKQLSNEADTEVFLGYVLAEMARQVDAALVHLFRYDASDHTLTLHLTYLKGKLRQGTSNDECELFAAPFPADITPAFELMCQHRQFMTPEATPIPVEEFAWPGALESLAHMQASDAAHLVLFVGDTPVGTMGLAFTDGKTLQKEDQPLVRALSQQCAIALRLSDLAERSQQAAIAREQQKAALERAAELESLNAALRRETRERCQAEEVIRSQNSALKHSLERLLQEPDIRGFLGALLDTLITQLQGHAANIWLLQDDRTTLTLWTAFALERLHTNPEETLIPYEPIPVDLVAQTILSVKAGWQETIHYSGDDPRLPLPLQEFHKHDRLCSVLTTPLRLGHHLLGWLAFATQEDLQQMPSDKVAFLEAIAHQATLAIRLHHLAEEAKQAAIAREQEKAAQERATELAKANHALRESLGSLATNPELDTFLGYMLLEMATQINAAKNHLFLYDQSTHTLSLHIFVRDGKVFSKEANDFELFAQPIPADITPAWRLMIQQKSSLNLALEQDNPNFWSGTYEWHRAQGHQGVLCVPLILGEEPLGFLGLSFTAKAILSPQEIELAQALAHQVTLAIQLTRLAEESRQAAILEERNRMAQEIHDTLAQAFAGIGMQLQAANRFRTTNPDKAQIHCDRAHALAQTGLTEARRSVWALSQEGLEYSDLSASVTRIAEQLTAETSLQVQIELQGTPYSVEPEVGLNLLRIAQEALTNALRHAQPQTIQIQITYEPSYVRLGVRDDGRGFDPQLPVKGFGLASMQQRVDHIGAQLLVSSQLGAGTEIAVILPMGE